MVRVRVRVGVRSFLVVVLHVSSCCIYLSLSLSLSKG
jgi:hypothetical protein